jgi:hypothetical protein
MSDPYAIDDPRLCFYLERREQIDEWAALRALEPPALDRFLQRLQPEVEQIAEDLGPDVRSAYLTVEKESMLTLHKDPWVISTHDPAIVVQLGWWPSSTRFASATDWVPWVGVRARRNPPFEALRAEIGLAIDASPTAKSAFTSGSPTGKSLWPRSSTIACEYAGYWDDLGPYRDQLLAKLREGFDVFAPLIDDVIAANQQLLPEG